MLTHAPNQFLSNQEDWDSSASYYDSYASHQRLYRESAELLVELAELGPGMTVLDLACGTGVSTEVILRRLRHCEAKVIGVDFSAEMLAFAERRINSDKVEFHFREAEKLSEVIYTKVDRVICNAAFWQFDMEKVFSEISRILKPSGKCLINFPSYPWLEIDNFSQLYDKHRYIWMILEEKLLRGYRSNNLATHSAKQKMSADRRAVLEGLIGRDLRMARIENIDLFLPPRDHIAFFQIPIMAKNSFLFRDVPAGEVREILDAVSSQIEWVELPDSPVSWQVCVIEPACGGSPTPAQEMGANCDV